MSALNKFVYRSSCHCQSVIFYFTAEKRLEHQEINLCNCSICNKNGYINYYVAPSDIQFEKGEAELKIYSFPPHNRKHKFCPRCGTSVLIFSNETIPDNGKIGINLRTVDDLNIQKLKTKIVDGRSRDPQDEMRAWEDEKARRKE